MLLHKKDIFNSTICVFLLFLIIYYFALIGNLSLFNFIALPLLCLLMIYKSELIIAFYIIILPTAGVVSTEDNIFEIFGIDEFINLLIIGYFIFKNLPKYKQNVDQKFAISLLFIMIFIGLFTNFKNAYFDIYDIDSITAFKRIFFMLLKFFPLLLIIKHIRNYTIRKNVYIGLYLSGVVIVVSQIFNTHLKSIGLITFDDSEFVGLAQNISQVNRVTGFYNGDPNSVGAYLLMLIGFILFKIENKHQTKLLYPLVLFFLFGILMTASRTIFVAFGMILLLFLYNNKSKKYSVQILFYLIVVLLFMSDFIFNQFSRFHNAHYQVDTNLEGNRIMKWVYYISFLLDSPLYFLTGSQSEIDNRAAHNVYIQTLFNVGLFPLILLISRFYRSIKLLIKINIRSLYFLIPFICITMFVGELKEFPLYTILIVLFSLENIKINKNLKNI